MASWPKRMLTAAGRVAAALHQCGDVIGGVSGRLRGLQFDRDGVEVHAFKDARDRFGVAWQAIAIGPDRAGEDERQPGRAVRQLMQRLGVGDCWIRMIDARLHRPGAAAPGDRAGVGCPRIQRLDRDAVVGLGGQPFQRPVLERRPHKLQPVLAACGRKFGGERQVVRH